MSVDSLAALTIHELHSLISAGKIQPQQLLEDLLERIEYHNGRLHAYLSVDPDRLHRQLEDQLRTRKAGRLAGIPITLKDNLCVSAEEITCASRILRGFRCPYDATVVQRLREEGAVIIPRANMDEFAFGSSTENSAFGGTRNPWALDRVPGGSSGGSACAVSADMAIAALGSDTGGSIRQPACCCGVVGLKPTYGRVSRYGLVAFASSLDQIGPITKDVTDAAILLGVIAGHDARDSTCAPVEVPDYVSTLQWPVKKLRIGIPKEYFVEGIDTEVKAALDEAVRTFERLGLVCESISLPHTPYAIATYYLIATAEASSNLARYDGVQYGYRSATNLRQESSSNGLLEMHRRTRTEGFGSEVKRRILLGTYVLSQGYYEAYYLKGMKVRTLIKQDFDAAWSRCDVILTPTAPTPAFRIGEKLENPLQMYLSDVYTISANLAGIPGLSMPCGFSREGLPLGMQLLAAPFKEQKLLQIAYAYEQATDWHRRKPTLSRQQIAQSK